MRQIIIETSNYVDPEGVLWDIVTKQDSNHTPWQGWTVERRDYPSIGISVNIGRITVGESECIIVPRHRVMARQSGDEEASAKDLRRVLTQLAVCLRDQTSETYFCLHYVSNRWNEILSPDLEGLAVQYSQTQKHPLYKLIFRTVVGQGAESWTEAFERLWMAIPSFNE